MPNTLWIANYDGLKRSVRREGAVVLLWKYQAAFPGLTVTGSSERNRAA